MAHTTKLIVQQITRQTRRQPHPGQADSSERKCDNRAAKKLELTATAQAKGITITELVRQRAAQTEEIRSKSMAAAKAEERTPVVRPSIHPPHPWLSWLH